MIASPAESSQPMSFRVPDRGSGNPTPLGGMGLRRARCRLGHGKLQARQPHGLGLQVSVWVTKYRYAVLGGDVGQRCRELLRETARAHEMVVHAGSINRDHVHLLLSIPP